MTMKMMMLDDVGASHPMYSIPQAIYPPPYCYYCCLSRSLFFPLKWVPLIWGLVGDELGEILWVCWVQGLDAVEAVEIGFRSLDSSWV